MKNFINRLVFFVGWVLSPFTFWNDAFVNIPLSYIAANLLLRIVHMRFVTMMLICYWISNVLGLIMMYVSGRGLVKGGKGLARELVKLLLTMALYSIMLVLLAKIGILRPMK